MSHFDPKLKNSNVPHGRHSRVPRRSPESGNPSYEYDSPINWHTSPRTLHPGLSINNGGTSLNSVAFFRETIP